MDVFRERRRHACLAAAEIISPRSPQPDTGGGERETDKETEMKYYEVWNGNHSCGFWRARNSASAIRKAEKAAGFSIKNPRAEETEERASELDDATERMTADR